MSAGLAACAGSGSGQVQYSAQVTTPELVYIEPEVQVVADYHEPVFYTDNYYWRYDNGTWYRSDNHAHGWVRFEAIPPRLRRIEQPTRYVRWRGEASGGVNTGGPVVRDHRQPQPYQAQPQPTYPAQPQPQPTYPTQPQPQPTYPVQPPPPRPQPVQPVHPGQGHGVQPQPQPQPQPVHPVRDPKADRKDLKEDQKADRKELHEDQKAARKDLKEDQKEIRKDVQAAPKEVRKDVKEDQKEHRKELEQKQKEERKDQKQDQKEDRKDQKKGR